MKGINFALLNLQPVSGEVLEGREKERIVKVKAMKEGKEVFFYTLLKNLSLRQISDLKLKIPPMKVQPDAVMK